MICVVIADDYDVVRRGLSLLLKRAPDMEAVGEAADGREGDDYFHTAGSN